MVFKTFDFLFTHKPFLSLLFELSKLLSNALTYYMLMSENINNSEQQNKIADQNIELNDTAVVKDKKGFWRLFLRFSGFTIVFALLSMILIIIGLVLFYKSGAETVILAGKWMTIAGVVTFLFTVIFGFERIEK